MRLRNTDDHMIPLAPGDLPEWEEMRRDLTATLRFATSIDLLYTEAPLNARVFDSREYGDIAVEKVIFESLPGFYVTGNLYRPRDLSRKYPALLNPHGHWERGRLQTGDITDIPKRCANFALRGMVAFAYDMVGRTDSVQVPHGFYDRGQERWNFGCLAMQTLNSKKALDFLESLPYVDSARMGMTGCSGGGTQTFLLGALDERIRAAAPINMVSATMQGGCTCENAPFLRTKYCNVDFCNLFAPRPLFLSASDGDWTRASEESEFPAVARVYGLYGAGERFRHFYQHAPHCYNRAVRERVYPFFCEAFGIRDPFDGEVEISLCPEKLAIGDFPKRPGDVKDTHTLFRAARRVMEKNLQKESGEAQRDRLVRTLALDRELPLDIPYFVRDKYGDVTVTLGPCPRDGEVPGLVFSTCYNYAPDTARVNGLVHLFRAFPGAKFIASGKTAGLCRVAARLVPGTDLSLKDPAERGIFIPGSALIRKNTEH